MEESTVEKKKKKEPEFFQLVENWLAYIWKLKDRKGNGRS